MGEILSKNEKEVAFSDAQFDEERFEAQLTADRMSRMVCYYWTLKLEARFMSGRRAQSFPLQRPRIGNRFGRTIVEFRKSRNRLQAIGPRQIPNNAAPVPENEADKKEHRGRAMKSHLRICRTQALPMTHPDFIEHISRQKSLRLPIDEGESPPPRK